LRPTTGEPSTKANERGGDTKADIVRRHFGDEMPEDEGSGSVKEVDSRPGG